MAVMADYESAVATEVDGSNIVTGEETQKHPDDISNMIIAEDVGVDDIEERLIDFESKTLSSDSDYESAVATEGDGNHIVTGEETQRLTDDFANMVLAEEVGVDDIKERLYDLENKILSFDSDYSMIWDKSPEEASDFLQVANEVRQIDEYLRTCEFTEEEEKRNELLNFAQSILQMAMARLEDEFVHLLVKNRQSPDPKHLRIPPAEEESVEDFSKSSFGDESIEGSTNTEPEDTVIDLIHPAVVSNLNSIAKLMFLSNYGKECYQAYIKARKDALDECLLVLQMEKFSIEEILKIDWKALHCLINIWKHTMKVFIRVYLASERRLCDLIFGELPRSVRESCFVETSKSSLLQLLSFGEAVAISTVRPEKLFQLLNMYETLDDLLMDIEYFFPEDYGSSILIECHEVLLRFRDSIRGTIKAFGYEIQSNMSTTPFAGGGVHPLTKYVMNFVKALAAYSKTVNLLLKDQPGGHQDSTSDHAGGQDSTSEHGGECSNSVLSSPFAQHLKSVTSILESNLDGKSHLYKDDALQNIFLMNNICYMVQKVKNSDLRNLLGDEWVRGHIWKFQNYARSYQRASWTSVLSFLKVEGLNHSGPPSKKVLKQRFTGFNLAFEEIYKVQTGWLVPDDGLRDDLRISISNLLQAYRIFVGRYAGYLDDEKHKFKYIKYCIDDLELYLLDLFGGSQKSL